MADKCTYLKWSSTDSNRYFRAQYVAIRLEFFYSMAQFMKYLQERMETCGVKMQHVLGVVNT